MQDPFDTLGLDRRFDLDDAQLHRHFLERSAASHPDRFTDPIEQADAADRSAGINEAYRVLKDPEQRANALLRLLGGASKEDDKSLPPDLLMEMMEVRERQEAAEASGDDGALRSLAAWARQQRQDHLGRIGRLFSQAAAGPDPQVLRQIRLELNALRYFQRMVEQAPAK